MGRQVLHFDLHLQKRATLELKLIGRDQPSSFYRIHLRIPLLQYFARLNQTEK